MNEIERAINALEMLRELMLFDPTTGEDIQVESLNEDNKDLHHAAETALTALREKAEQENPKPLTLEELMQRIGKPIWKQYPGTGEGEWDVLIPPAGRFIFFKHSMEAEYGKTWLAYDHKPKH